MKQDRQKVTRPEELKEQPEKVGKTPWTLILDTVRAPRLLLGLDPSLQNGHLRTLTWPWSRSP